VSEDKVSANLRLFDAYSNLQTIGSDWYNAQESLVLKIPLAVISLEYKLNDQYGASRLF
jgi:hypothetical protein